MSDQKNTLIVKGKFYHFQTVMGRACIPSVIYIKNDNKIIFYTNRFIQSQKNIYLVILIPCQHLSVIYTHIAQISVFICFELDCRSVQLKQKVKNTDLKWIRIDLLTCLVIIVGFLFRRPIELQTRYTNPVGSLSWLKYICWLVSSFLFYVSRCFLKACRKIDFVTV